MPKRDEVGSLVDDNKSEVPVLTETWLHPEINDSELLPNSNAFNIYRKDCTDRRGGGVLLGIKKTLSSYIIDTRSAHEIIWVACKPSPNDIVLIGNCYRPPDANSSFNVELRKSVDDAISLCKTENVFLFGDFNLPLIDWKLLYSLCNVSNEFISLMLDFNLIQVVTEPTR